ncbi:MAG: serine hydroxymethyltransferase [Chloracidobacterium sp. CP2_5A]|nr:MAG: serine hydroxymethyltransferase [Chloracidobacterium sp. CP2_5A]
MPLALNRSLLEADPEIAQAITDETRRLSDGLEMIASENYASRAVMEAAGSVMTNKYAEGYPGRRYYGGCEFVDVAERLAIERAKRLFGAEHVNVQPHSGAQANLAVFLATLRPGDTILGMDLSHGGHLTHGHPLNVSGMYFNVVTYGVDRETERLDYDALAQLAEKHRPKLIICGASAYPRQIDFARIGEIGRSVRARVLADIAHIAGLVAAGEHPSPIGCVDFVTTTTHKTLRGPRGGLVMCRAEDAKIIDRAVFPGVQGGPLMHIIAAKAVCFREALDANFIEYQRQVRKNAVALGETLSEAGFRLVTGGTDNHLILVDVFTKGITGKAAEQALERAGITVNKNTIPFDANPPLIGSGIRLGTPALTTRGMREDDLRYVGKLIVEALSDVDNAGRQEFIRRKVREMTQDFPLYA